MDRRLFLAGGAALAAAGPALAAAPDIRSAAREAWLYGLPLLEMARARTRMTAVTAPNQAGVNIFGHSRRLADPRARGVTTPNVDTLYSTAWIDLTGGPQTLTLPATGDRYFSLALMDMYSNNFMVLGTRTTGSEGGTYTLVGPREAAPPGAIRCPTPWVWALAHTLVTGEDDMDGAHAIQDGLLLHGKAGRQPPVTGAGSGAPWNDYFFEVQELVAENPPPVSDTAFFHRIAPLQLGLRREFEGARFADSEITEIAVGVAEAHALLAAARGRTFTEAGWIYPQLNQGDFGQDYLYRAATALSGLAALPPAEAMYIRALAPDGAMMFPNRGAYRFSLPGPMPVDGFWSLTLYEQTPNGQLFLTENPLNRYAIGDRTPGLKVGANGSVDIWISRADPGDGRTSNWLPAPAADPFALVLRAYLPRPELLEGDYRFAPVQAVAIADAPPPPPPRRRRR